jgi:hypothetical protein
VNTRTRNLSLVVDEVLAEANEVSRRRAGEDAAIKEAAAQPKTALARELHALANGLRSDTNDIDFTDLVGAA